MENMNLVRVDNDKYREIVSNYGIFFNEAKFCELNKDKVKELHYLILYKHNVPRFGIVLGQVEKEMKCPFSAPYSYPIDIQGYSKMEDIDAALESVEQYCKDIGNKKITFTFPPLFYDEHLLSGWISAIYRHGFSVKNLDVNYSFDLDILSDSLLETYKAILDKKSRKHLNKANKTVKIYECKTIDEYKDSYDLIKANHDEKGRPTWMSFEDLIDTFELVEHDVFIATYNGNKIATMIYYRINNRIVQCIYSGYLSEYSNMGAMNLLFYYAIRYYKERGYKYIDRAIATENSIPNYGLCNFKESVGCTRSLKYSFSKIIN